MKLQTVARRTGITEGTAKTHLKRIRQKYEDLGRPAHTKTDPTARLCATASSIKTGREPAMAAAEAPAAVIGTSEPSASATATSAAAASATARSASEATERSVIRLVHLPMVVWVMAIAANTFAAATYLPVLGACGAAVALAYGIHTMRHNRWLLASVVIVVVLVVSPAGSPILSMTDVPVVIPWFNMATTVVGALIVGRIAALLVITNSLASGLLVPWPITRTNSPAPRSWPRDLLGLAIWAGVHPAAIGRPARRVGGRAVDALTPPPLGRPHASPNSGGWRASCTTQ